MERNDSFIKRLLETFRIEAAEHIGAIASGLIELEKLPAAERRAEVIEAVFREAHSMKGAARSVSLSGIESVCQSFENVLAALKRKEISPERPLLDLLHRSVNALSELLSAIETGENSREKARHRDLISELNRAARASSRGDGPSESEQPRIERTPSASGEAPSPTAADIPPPPVDTIRIAKTKLDSLLLQGESFLAVKQTVAQQSAELREITGQVASLRKALALIRPELRAARAAEKRRTGGETTNPSVIKLADFLESQEDGIAKLHYALLSLGKSQRQGQRSLGVMADGLLDDLKSISMQPFSSLLEIMPKIVRDLSHDQGKEAALVVRGGEIELDKRILDEMREPLIHLVRNAVDHGLEKPAERSARKKPGTGTITIAVSHREGKAVELIVSDDGNGIDTTGVRNSAIKLGIVTRKEAGELDEGRALSLLFRSGVSTSPIITDLSGRGLGLAIVRERVERLGGSIFCETTTGSGTIFRILLPLTLTTFRGVLVRVDDGQYVIPTTSLERTVRVRRDEIKSMENRDTIALEGRTVSYVPLQTVLELPRRDQRGGLPEFVQVAVLGTGEHRIAFGVDDILHEQEVLVKDLGGQLKRVRNVSGATVLGTGKVVPILNAADLLKSAVRVSSVAAPRTSGELTEGKKSILVVEDSITTRSLLKNILESLGYDVTTAVDGVDGLTALKTGAFDLVVSDVDMPRMNGFDLTATIRADKKLAETPVVLVTALESREDRERGVDVGANAYIVKSSFDQGNLLEAVKRLI